MKISSEFLRDVQRAGWDIKAVEPDGAIVVCPRQGCTLATKLRPGKRIPETCRRGPDFRDRPVRSYEDARLALRERRQALALAIAEVEDIAGLCEHHLAKAEKDFPSRRVQMTTFLDWCQALGLEVVLRPTDLPPLALSLVAGTRHLSERRQRQFASRRAEPISVSRRAISL